MSSACAEMAVQRGHEVTVFNRGATRTRSVPDGVEVIRDAQSTRSALGNREFDAVVNWVAYTPDHVRADVKLFAGRTRHYVFISSAAAYQTPPARLPVVGSTPLRNPFCQYSRDKLACERLLTDAYREHGFPVSVVRPSHTYDRTAVPFDGGWTIVARMGRASRSSCTVTHLALDAHTRQGLRHRVRPAARSPARDRDSFHITTDDFLTWNQIAYALAAAAGVEARLVHVPSDAIAAADGTWGAGLLGDKAHSLIFDNSRLRGLVPDFRPTISVEQGAQEIVAWHDGDPGRQHVDAHLDSVMDKLAAAYAVA